MGEIWIPEKRSLQTVGFSQAAGSCSVSGGFRWARIIDWMCYILSIRDGIPLVNGLRHFSADTLYWG